jgi:hypothetical protein
MTMPLEIRELVIKVNINERERSQDKKLDHVVKEMKDRIVEECMDKLLRKLETSVER